MMVTWSAVLPVLFQLNPRWTGTAVEGRHGGKKAQMGTASVSFAARSLNCGATTQREKLKNRRLSDPVRPLG